MAASCSFSTGGAITPNGTYFNIDYITYVSVGKCTVYFLESALGLSMGDNYIVHANAWSSGISGLFVNCVAKNYQYFSLEVRNGSGSLVNVGNWIDIVVFKVNT